MGWGSMECAILRVVDMVMPIVVCHRGCSFSVSDWEEGAMPRSGGWRLAVTVGAGLTLTPSFSSLYSQFRRANGDLTAMRSEW